MKRVRSRTRSMYCRSLRVLLLFLLLAPAWLPAHAQEAFAAWEVYSRRGETGRTEELLFVNLRTGELRTVPVAGERFTPLGSRVLYYDPVSQAVMIAAPDGIVRPHPFIQLDEGAARVDWVLSRDRRQIAWTLTYREAAGLRTVTRIASVNGANQRIVLEDGPRTDGVRAFPVTFAAENRQLVMDAHPDGIGAFAPYTQYARLFQVSLTNGTLELLPDDESPCFCGAALRNDYFLRLSVTADLRGFDVLVYNLQSGTQQTISALPLTNYTQAGDILISPDGTRAVYALSQIDSFGTPQQTVRTVFMLVDLETMTQRQLTEPVSTYVHPVRWTEDHTAILFTSPQRDGTWKIRLVDGVLSRIADATYIGLVAGALP